MKPLSRAFLLVGISILLATISITAQQKQARDSDLLRTKIEQFEQTDIASKSASVKSIYQRTLLRLYNEFSKALLQDISDLATMQSLVDGTSAESQKEVAALLRKLRQEQGETAEKIQTLSGDVQTATMSSPNPHTRERAVEEQTPQVHLRPASFNSYSTMSAAGPPEGSAIVAVIPSSDSLPARSARAASSSSQTTPDHPDISKIDQPKDGDLKIKGKPGAATKSATVSFQIDGVNQAQTTIARSDGSFTILLPAGAPLVANTELTFSQEVNDVPSDMTAAVTVLEKAKAEDKAAQASQAAEANTARGPFGVMVGGSVISNQSQSFSQADPFFGFIAGYTSNNKITKSQKRDAHNNVVPDSYTRKDWGTFNLRFEGLFNSAARTAKAPAAAATAGTPAPPTGDFPFLSSRKTFETGLQLWWEFPVPGSKFLTIGPYAALGTSSVLDKNELKDEDVRVDNKTGTGSATELKLDTSQVKTDNDLKRYFEYGMMLNVFLGNRGQFIHSTFAKGNFEALEGLYKDPVTGLDNYNTKKRFHARLDIFPTGLARGFGKQVKMTPMFGVDLNASRGADSLRFFSGFAVSIKAPKTGQDNPLGKEEDSDTTKK
jgi:hypothetical protein